MLLKFGVEQYRMSSRLSEYPKIGKIVSKLYGSTNVGQYARANIFKQVIKTLPIYDLKNILDLGCGQGEYALMLAKGLPKNNITALDVEADRIKKIAAIAKTTNIRNLKTHWGKIETIPGQEIFDFIYSIDVFEHISEPQMPFSDAYEKLKSGGYLFIKMPSKKQINILPSKWFEEHNLWLEEEHIGQVYGLEDLKNRIEDEGFIVQKAFYADGILSRLAWELAYLSKKAGAIVQLLTLPYLKILVLLDRIIPLTTNGNTIQVVAQKK